LSSSGIAAISDTKSLNFWAGDELRIIPVGAAKGWVFQALLGTALCCCHLDAGSVSASNLMFSVGAAMAVGGVVQMLSPQVSGCGCDRTQITNLPMRLAQSILQHPVTPFLCFTGGNRRCDYLRRDLCRRSAINKLPISSHLTVAFFMDAI
jgi:hypothetical protein